jgi:S1-C subfamily serine protease
VLERVKDEALKPQYLNQLLDDLLEHDIAGAQSYAESLVQSPLPADSEARERALIAARTLVRHAPDCGWSVVWEAMNADMTFGRDVVESIAGGHARRGVGERLPESDVANLYRWLVREYPPAVDPQVEGMHTVTTRESVGQLRDSLLQHLKMRGTHEACRAIERLMSELPELPNLQWILREAEEETRRRTWIPPSPTEIVNLARGDKHESSSGIRRAETFKRLLPLNNREQIFQSLWVLHCAKTLEHIITDGDDELSDICGQGSAFTLAGVGVVTCQHVLCPHTVAFRADSPAKWYKIELIVQNEALDLALIRIIAPPADAGLERGDAAYLEPPKEIAVAGFPHWKRGASGVIIPGHVVGDFIKSGIRRRLIDAAIVAGNSGGPVLDDLSRVVGVAVTGADSMDKARHVEHGVIPINALYHLLQVGEGKSQRQAGAHGSRG